LAVLPFVNLTGDAAKDYLGDGMAEEVINQLTRLPSLKVPARTSSFAYKGRGTDIRQIAKDLGVATVLEGSVREAGARIRITAQLIDARTGLHIWSHTYDERFTDLFKLQDDLANAIVQALQVNLNGTAITTTWQLPPTQNVEAYDLDLQGEALLERSTVQSIRRALDYFQQSTDRDRNFVRAYADIAGARYLLAGPFGQQPIENLDKAHSAALRALTLNASSSEAHMVLAAVGLSRGDWLEAAAQSRMSLSLNSGDGGVHEAQGALLDNAGHLGEALEEQRRAQALAPTSPSVALNTAIAYLLLGRDVEALKSARVAADLGWSDSALSFVREESALHAGRYADATAAALAMLDVQVPDQARTAAIIKRVYAALADPRTKTLAMRARAQLYPQSREVEASAAMVADVRPCLQSSYMYALLGERDIAYDLANQCLDSKAPGGIAEGPLARLWTPELHAFRQDPRFQALATRLGLMAYWQKYGPPDNCELKANRLICS
jgi:TolB-like protein/Flp pilus assembly protein TadD